MTRKDFMLQGTEAIMENPRKVLAGHGIPAAVLTKLTGRPDVIAKLLSIGYSLKTSKKGPALSLKKSPGFAIKGYKDFASFNKMAREDVSTFMGTLKPEDASKFSNSGNIVTLMCLPDVGILDDNDIETGIISGKSVMMRFDNAVKAEYKIPGGFYIIVMVADSTIMPKEDRIAQKTEKKNKRKYNRRTPAKIKAEIKAKANKRLSKINSQLNDYTSELDVLNAENEQLAYISKRVGAKQNSIASLLGKIRATDAASQRGYKQATQNFASESVKYQQNIASQKAFIDSLDAEAKGIYRIAVKMVKSGKKAAARALIAELPENTRDIITMALSNTKPTAAKAPMTVTKTRQKELKAQIRKLTAANEQYALDLHLSTDSSKSRSIRSMISKNNSAIRTLRAKLGTYNNLSVKAVNNKAKRVAEITEKVAELTAEGLSVKQAMDTALANVGLTPAQQEIVKQQVFQEVADGMPVEYAAQQAVQTLNVEQQSSSLTGSSSIQQMLSRIG